jgi:hypothetical protein
MIRAKKSKPKSATGNRGAFFAFRKREKNYLRFFCHSRISFMIAILAASLALSVLFILALIRHDKKSGEIVTEISRAQSRLNEKK